MEPTDLVCLANEAIQETELAPASSGLDLTKVNASSLPVNTSDEIGLELVGMHAGRLTRFASMRSGTGKNVSDAVSLFKFNCFVVVVGSISPSTKVSYTFQRNVRTE